MLIPYIYRNPEYSDENEYYYSVEKEGKKYLVSWKIKEPKNDIYALCEAYSTTKFINVADKDRNKILGYNGANGNLPRDKNTIKEFWSNIIPFLNKYKVKSLLDENFEILQQEIESESEEEKYIYKTFEDYPEEVQKEANDILNNLDFIEEVLNTINWKHEGDKKTMIIELLSCGSLFIHEPVHQYKDAKKGKGKTNGSNEIKGILPDQYVVDLPSFSSKSIYYHSTTILHPEFNFIFLDDIVLNEDKDELLKLITDNNRPMKSHKTVINGKPVEFILIGEYLVIMNRADTSNMNDQLFDRLYLNELENDENHEIKVKNKIKQNSILETNVFLEKKRTMIKCAIQKLVDNNVKIFNPYLIFLNIKHHANRNINHYLGLIKAKTFFYQYQRSNIDDIIIGSIEDMEFVLSKVSESFETQKNKLDHVERSIIDFLKKNKGNEFKLKELEKPIGMSNEHIKNKIFGKDGKMGLEAKGYVSVIQKDPNNIRSPYYVQYVENDSTPFKSEKSFTTLTTNTSFNEKNSLILKWNLIIPYLTLKQILINKNLVYSLEPILEKIKLDINNYENVVSFIKKSFNEIKDMVEYITEDKTPSSEDLDYHKNFTQTKYDDFVKFIEEIENEENISKNHENNFKQKNHSNQKQALNNSTNLKNKEIFEPFEDKKDYTKEIENILINHLNVNKKEKFDELLNLLIDFHNEWEEKINQIIDLMWELKKKSIIDISDYDGEVELSIKV